MNMMKIIFAQKGVLWSIVAILVLTILEFPAPIGFETRPQGNVSLLWLVFFLAILISEVAAMLLIFKRPLWGAKLAITAAILNILQVAADLTHMMQPEVASLGYTLLEGSVVFLSLLLIYFAIQMPRSVASTA